MFDLSQKSAKIFWQDTKNRLFLSQSKALILFTLLTKVLSFYALLLYK